MSTVGEDEHEKPGVIQSMATSVNNVVMAKLPEMSLSPLQAWQPRMWF